MMMMTMHGAASSSHPLSENSAALSFPRNEKKIFADFGFVYLKAMCHADDDFPAKRGSVHDS